MAAYGIAVIEGALPFDIAYPLAKLVIENNGYPVPIGKAFRKRTANALKKAGVISVHTDYPEEYEGRILQGVAPDGTRTFSAQVWMKPEPGTPSLYAVVTDEAIAMVKRHLP